MHVAKGRDNSTEVRLSCEQIELIPAFELCKGKYNTSRFAHNKECGRSKKINSVQVYHCRIAHFVHCTIILVTHKNDLTYSCEANSRQMNYTS